MPLDIRVTYKHIFDNQRKMEALIAPHKDSLIIKRAGIRWILRGVNDLGYLYWSKMGQEKQYVVENFTVNNLPELV